MSSYKELKIFQEGKTLFLEVHPLTLKLPRFEIYELGSQLRRSADSVVSNIVEGYGRSSYKGDYIRFLTFSRGSCLETIEHLEKLKILYPEHEDSFQGLLDRYNILSAKIFAYIGYVKREWRT